MKKIILVFICCLPLLSISQKAPALHPAAAAPMTKPPANETGRIDTIITKDPMNPAREYWVVHNLKGMIRARGSMLNGKKDGVWREYSEANGVITKLTEYTGGVANGASLAFGFNGNIMVDETLKNDKKTGERLAYGQYGGRIKSFETYSNDTLDGVKKVYYDDGKIQEDGFYKNGLRNGTVKWFKQNGVPTMEYTYENGVMDGPAKIYDDNGKLKQEGVYRNNNEEGEWKEYQDSLLVKKIIYKQGQILKEIPVKK